MTRLELLKLLIAQARANGFQFRRWYTQNCGRPWVTPEDAIQWLSVGRRSYVLLFSTEFATQFWKSGERITFMVSAQEFQRVLPDGSTMTIKRKPYTRRSGRPDVWKYHLREMAGSGEPLRYIRNYVLVEEDLDMEETSSESHGDM